MPAIMMKSWQFAKTCYFRGHKNQNCVKDDNKVRISSVNVFEMKQWLRPIKIFWHKMCETEIESRLATSPAHLQLVTTDECLMKHTDKISTNKLWASKVRRMKSLCFVKETHCLRIPLTVYGLFELIIK